MSMVWPTFVLRTAKEQNRYEMPVILSDHNAVVMTPRNRTTDRSDDVTVQVCSQDSNSRTLLGQAIINTDWTPLYRLETCDEMTQSFYDTITRLVDYYLPLMSQTSHDR